MKNRQIYLLIAILVATSVSVGTAYAFGNLETKPIAPSYADECAHGHNGFNCNPPQYRVDINDLQVQERDIRSDIKTLESKIIQLEEKLSIVDNVLINRISVLEGKP